MAAKRLAKLKGFDLKEEYFEPVYHPADLVEHIAYYAEGETYNTNVRFLTSRVQPIQAITATTGWI